ncbi:MAG: family 20 glycosylhydrolase [Clostridia bacterium]|nr:family 20 glycosylhydrolase [Clostridia bacterium]
MLEILPLPKKYNTVDQSTHPILPSVYTAESEWIDDANTFCGIFEKIFNLPISVAEPAGIRLKKNPTLSQNEYTLDTCGDSVLLCASAREGLLYGLATALQLIDCKNGTPAVASVQITDSPAQEYRAFMLDAVSKPQSMKQLFKYIDLCFFYKINYLHLHFADGAAFRYPSKRLEALPSKFHYSEEDIVQLRSYASSRGIKLVPEIECPGHATILNRSYPEHFHCDMEGNGEVLLSELGDPINPESLICAGSEKSFEAVKALIDELAELFPDSEYIHIGGDEAPHNCWAHCKACRAYMEQHGLKSTKELYSEYVGRIASYVLSIGRKPIVWEGFASESSHFVPKETIVIAWESHYQTAPDLLKNGFRIINASWQPTYFVPSLVHRWDAEKVLSWDPHVWEHWWEQSEAYEKPISIEPTEALLGASLCAWGLSFELLIGRLMENLPAFSQCLWSPDEKPDFTIFYTIYKKIGDKAARLALDEF